MRSLFLSNRAARDAGVLAASGIGLWLIARNFDLGEALIGFLEANEAYEADELFLAILATGTCGFLYAFRRLRDVGRETKMRRKAEADAIWVSQHDILTRLPNRRMVDLFTSEIRASGPPIDGYTIFAIDLSYFKSINEQVGFEGGNKLLVEIASRLRNAFPGELVARLGADEFLVVSRKRPDVLTDAGYGIIKAIERPFAVDGIEIETSACIGIAVSTEHGCHLADSIRLADLALQSAKRRNRTAVTIFDPSMDEAVARRSIAEASLRQAIADGEIVPHYQPVIDLRSGRVTGFEALARWIRPNGEIVPPNKFIELAEASGMIAPLSDRLLRRACRDAASWPAGISVAFNVSPVQLTDRLLALRILQVVVETGLQPQRLEIEITESALMGDLDSAMQIVESLHAAGVRIALDDFGTGYSSLSQLSRLPFDKLKIDRSFVAACRGEAKQAKIVKSIIGMAQGLGIVTTAEGIEREDQRQLLKDMGSNYGQGYLFGKAMSADQVLAYLAAQQDEPLPIAQAV
ncbi:putative bifunctional diguanylate cyclase/phosphodiesterase [Devosia sp.]|uniref:putative bifunctional diguanylate cyclase/phosphodiesterase n=1 Tax=Devosia sp. TaxID=1871048 RepID=UPI003A932ECC